MSHFVRALAVGTLALGVCAGCSAQKDQDYSGDPLVQVRGTVQTSSATTPVDAEVILVWTDFVDSPDTTTQAVAAKVRGSFPSRFVLDILTPPPSTAMNDLAATEVGVPGKEVPFAIASIMALQSGGPTTGTTDDIALDRMLGMAEDNVVVYVPRDVQPRTVTSVAVGGALLAGFHLMKVIRLTDAETAAITACRDALPPDSNQTTELIECGIRKDHLVEEPGGFATEVQVRLAPLRDLHFPDLG